MKTKSSGLAQRAARGTQRRLQTLSIQRALRQRGLSGATQIPTFTTRDELEALYHLAAQCDPKARVLEVGSYLGASTCYIAAGLPDKQSTIICIDTWQNQTMPDGIRDTFAQFETNLKSVKDQLTLIRKPSSEVKSREIPGPFDLVFLDGDHSYRQTKSDYELVKDLVAKNGILAFHDSLFFEGVSRVIGEALASAQWQIGGTVGNLFWLTRARFPNAS